MTEAGHDIVIAGGGMVGGALALALATRGYSIAVIEARMPRLEWDPARYDPRVSAITRVSQQMLINLGAWPAIVADRVTAYQHMRVWDRAGFGEIHFDAADLAAPDLGHIIENRVIVRALWQALAEAGVTVFAPTGIRQQITAEDDVTLVLDDGRRLTARLLVAADGAGSQTRTTANIAVRSSDYDQHAVVATVRAERGNQATAWQRFLPTGPLALLPLQRELFSIVWSTSPVEAERLRRMATAEFDTALTTASESRLGQLTLVGDRGVFPLRMQHAQDYVRPGLALVGDAAHVIHPLAGQGVNLGFLDAAALVDAIEAGREAGRGPGCLRTLRAYERSRKGHNTATQLAMDGFKHLFGARSGALSLARNLGLATADRIAPLRRVFARVALGQGLDLPRLSRPPAPPRNP